MVFCDLNVGVRRSLVFLTRKARKYGNLRNFVFVCLRGFVITRRWGAGGSFARGHCARLSVVWSETNRNHWYKVVEMAFITNYVLFELCELMPLEQGAGSREQGAGSREQGAGSSRASGRSADDSSRSLKPEA